MRRRGTRLVEPAGRVQRWLSPAPPALRSGSPPRHLFQIGAVDRVKKVSRRADTRRRTSKHNRDISAPRQVPRTPRLGPPSTMATRTSPPQPRTPVRVAPYEMGWRAFADWRHLRFAPRIGGGTAPAVEQGTEAGDCYGGVCARRIGERSGPARGYRSRTDLSLVEREHPLLSKYLIWPSLTFVVLTRSSGSASDCLSFSRSTSSARVSLSGSFS
jgi:hypothetical protein